VALLRTRLVALLLLLLAVESSFAAPSATPEQVQAAFLCSFVEFVDWPPGAADSPVTIGILGDDPFRKLVEETARVRPLQTKSIVVKRVTGVEEALLCQMVYIGGSERKNLDAILRSLSAASILTVSDIQEFAQRGGMIGFTIEENRVRFAINVEAAERANVRVSSRLLKLAKIVGPDGRSGS
jgi:hypothetical protein